MPAIRFGSTRGYPIKTQPVLDVFRAIPILDAKMGRARERIDGSALNGFPTVAIFQ